MTYAYRFARRLFRYFVFIIIHPYTVPAKKNMTKPQDLKRSLPEGIHGRSVRKGVFSTLYRMGENFSTNEASGSTLHKITVSERRIGWLKVKTTGSPGYLIS
jgi:hypothetical protein